MTECENAEVPEQINLTIDVFDASPALTHFHLTGFVNLSVTSATSFANLPFSRLAVTSSSARPPFSPSLR